MSVSSLKDLRYKLTENQIISVMHKFNVDPVYITETAIIFPTACHNLVGGSPKLYYYKADHIFKCYTHCNDMFDIFTLIVKMQALRGVTYTIGQAIDLCGLDRSSFLTEKEGSIQTDIDYLYNLQNIKNDLIELPTIDNQILDRFVFDKNVLNQWAEEGISFDTMRKYGIKYDPVDNCIIIPNYDIAGNLISIRGRYLDEDAPAKYKPIVWGGKVLSHPSALSLYGLNITKAAISKQRRAIIFESEKAVMMMDTIYGDKNCAVATLGQNVSKQQIRLLTDLGVEEIILAYDADYHNYNEMLDKRKKYLSIAKSLKPYFSTAVLIDSNFTLHYKDSPIDRGQQKFEQILQNRIYV